MDKKCFEEDLGGGRDEQEQDGGVNGGRGRGPLHYFEQYSLKNKKVEGGGGAGKARL